MISLPFLWKWLYINFVPLEDGEEDGYPKEDLIKELLATKEVDKEGNEPAAIFAKALVGRYLCLLYRNSDHCKTRFSSSKNPTLFTLRKVDEEDRPKREESVPIFPEDLRLRILKELREERLGRSSARNLLQLMTQPPKKKARTMEDRNLTPELVSISGSPSEDGTTTTATTSGMLSPPASPSRRSLKRSASGELTGASETKRRELPPSSAAAAGHAAPYRALRKQASSPVLTQGKGGAGGVPPLFSQQEPWKREINDLWAKQLAMMREINTLKVELGRREAARQREILAMRQELDVMRAEIFRLRQIHGVGPLVPPIPEKEGKEGEEGASVGDAAAAVDESVTEADKIGEASEMDTSMGEDKAASPEGSLSEN